MQLTDSDKSPQEKNKQLR